jgi:hypothetical protein
VWFVDGTHMPRFIVSDGGSLALDPEGNEDSRKQEASTNTNLEDLE